MFCERKKSVLQIQGPRTEAFLSSSPWDSTTHVQDGSTHQDWPNLETSSQASPEVCLLGDQLTINITYPRSLAAANCLPSPPPHWHLYFHAGAPSCCNSVPSHRSVQLLFFSVQRAKHQDLLGLMVHGSLSSTQSQMPVSCPKLTIGLEEHGYLEPLWYLCACKSLPYCQVLTEGGPVGTPRLQLMLL